MDLRDLLRELVKRHRNQTALAQAMGIDRSRISKILKGVEYPTLEVQNCLRLADVTGESPREILTAAGKGDVADLIECARRSESGPVRRSESRPPEAGSFYVVVT